MVCDKGIPLKIAAAALQYGKELGTKTVFNPSPKLESLPQEVYLHCDTLVLNREEGESLTDISAGNMEGAMKVVFKLHQWGTSQVVLTLGSEGAISSEITSQRKGELSSLSFYFCYSLSQCIFMYLLGLILAKMLFFSFLVISLYIY